MSSFEHANICKKTNFYSLHVAPQDYTANVDGVISVSNNLTSKQKYEFRVDATTNNLNISTQNGTSTMNPLLSLNTNNTIDVHNNKVINVATPVNSTDAVTKGYVDTAITNISIPPLPMKKYGFPQTVTGPIVPAFQNKTIYTFDLTALGFPANTYNQYTFYFNNITASVTTASVNGISYDVFLRDIINANYNINQGVLKYNTGTVQNNSSFNSGNVTMTLSVAPSTTVIYLNVFQTSGTQSGTLSNIAFNCDIIGEKVLF